MQPANLALSSRLLAVLYLRIVSRCLTGHQKGLGLLSEETEGADLDLERGQGRIFHVSGLRGEGRRGQGGLWRPVRGLRLVVSRHVLLVVYEI